ncbi:MAG: VIT1/CCC1 transporter family protein [Cyclobacteriaceae bacterium]|jgi:VIT1/CCC1 family predicted Fe2+/Mn2+ transporter|nr:VIT1/CCC1 transporter family protein [Cyclobacteriaceae bacterium]
MKNESKVWKAYWQEEVDAAFLYQILAKHTANTIEKASYLKLSDIEDKHAQAWEKMMEADLQKKLIRQPSFKAKLLAQITDKLGTSLLKDWLSKEESSEVKSYLQLYKKSKDADTRTLALRLAQDSAQHAEQLGKMNNSATEPWHKTSSGGMLRNVVYGFNDGLTANFGLLAGIVGAQAAPHIILLSGVAGTLANALSMGSSGYLAAKSEKEVYEKERRMEADEIRLMPELETEELAAIYESKGIDSVKAKSMAKELMLDPEKALEEKVKEELGISAEEISPMKEAWVTGSATAIGSIIPVLPFLFSSGAQAAWASFVLAMAAHYAVGAARSFFTGKGLWKSGWEMLLVGFGVAAVGYFLGEWLFRIL